MLRATTSVQRWIMAFLAFLLVSTGCARSVPLQSLSGLDDGALATGNASLVKRQNDNLVVDWADRGPLLNKGNGFVCAFSQTNYQIWAANNNQNPQSIWTQYDDLAAQGWDDDMYISGAGDEDDDADNEPAYGTDIDDALEGLGSDPENWGKISALHANNWVWNDVEYEATGADYQQVVYPVGGILAADVNFSPAAASYGTRPPLERWSDVAYLQWEAMCAQFSRSVRDLSAILRVHVVNKQSAAWIIASVKNYDSRMGNAPRARMPTWANRITFGIETEEARVLLGTPNGSGGAFLLNTHKDQLGLKRISEVVVWDYEGSVIDGPRESMGLCMAFIVEDV
ncbi:uncharacterized protein N0V89_008069 [Didymosphaeria variabile]|uniref:Uncharacterized protein n=1 Tax=Didymosphaeria variabile TaxID=1932322 RepID=A0A9W8XGW5_9PLEO|nr:uncharacterized protein N0V89_008069 [Didymosphaeria variabile]KAJ4349454.1 hypothetical protein N0V89_008069 [Didymosphaeria variabile]